MKVKALSMLGILSGAALLTSMAHADVIKIAFIDPLSGPFALQGQSNLRQIQFVADRAAKEKWAGNNTFEIVGFDNKGSPQESLTILKQVIDQGYHYVTQGAGSGAGLAILDAVNKHNERNAGKELLYLNWGAQDPDMTNSKCSFWHFRFLDNSDMKLEALTTEIAKDRNIKRVYIIGQNYAYGQQITKSAKEYLKRKRPDIEIVGDDLHPIGQVKDFSPYVAKIKASNADLVLTGNWGPDFTLLIKAAKDANLTVPIYAFSAIQAGAAAAVGDPGNVKIMTMNPWVINNEGYKGLDYQTEYRKKYNEDFIWMASQTIIGMMSQAVKKANSTDPVKVAFALEGSKFEGPVGTIEMRKEDHQVQQPLYILSLAKKDGKEVKYDQENTGYGWKPVKKIDSYVAAQPTTCQMKRPSQP